MSTVTDTSHFHGVTYYLHSPFTAYCNTAERIVSFLGRINCFHTLYATMYRTIEKENKAVLVAQGCKWSKDTPTLLDVQALCDVAGESNSCFCDRSKVPQSSAEHCCIKSMVTATNRDKLIRCIEMQIAVRWHKFKGRGIKSRYQL